MKRLIASETESVNVCESDQSSKFDSADFTEDETTLDGDRMVESEAEPLLLAPPNGPSKCRCWSNFTVEPLMFFLMVASFLQNNVTKNMIIEKICLDSLDVNQSTDICKDISVNKTFEHLIQTQTATIEMYMSIVDTVPAIFVSIFIGSFSDKHGRKLPMMFPVVGFMLTTAVLGFFSYYMTEIPAKWIPLAGLPKAFGGGLMAVIAMCLSYVSDKTTAAKRTMKVASVEGMILLAQPVGTLSGGWLYIYSYPLVYLVSFALLLFVLVYIIIFISDTRIVPLSDNAETSLLRDFFDINHFKVTVMTVLKKRAFHARRHILLLMFVAAISLMPFFGNASLLYLYTRLRLNWDLMTYSYFAAIVSVSISLGLLFMAVVLSRILKFPDPMLAIVGLSSSVISSLLIAFVISPVMMYLICVPSAFGGGTSLAVRSQVSKLVPREEQGKVFSVLGTLDTIVPLVATVLYTQIYNATVATVPGTVFLTSAAILIPPLLVVLYLLIDMRKCAVERAEAELMEPASNAKV